MPNVPFTDYDQAFCAPAAAAVFHGVAGGHHIYKPDPFDVPAVHCEARRCFDRLVARHTGPGAPGTGSIFLLKGRAGSGKTHLLRAFRDRVHRDETGYVGYLQLTSETHNYHRYILSALVEHLQHPYHGELDTRSGLRRLSDAMAEASTTMGRRFRNTGRAALETLQEGSLPQQMIVRVVEMLAPHILQEPRYSAVDIDLVRVLLYLQTGNPRLENLVKKYLRAERLAPQDEEALGNICSLTDEAAPARMLAQLGHLMWQTQHELLVIEVDQVENIASMDNARERFQRAVNALTSLANDVPSSIIVLACLEDYYINLRDLLLASAIDRLEQDPEPILLSARPGTRQLAAILARRLAHLYAAAGLAVPDPGTYPFDAAALGRLAGLTIRDVLAFARKWQQQCAEAGRMLPPPLERVPRDTGATPESRDPEPMDTLRRAWNDHLHINTFDVPDRSHALAALLSEGIGYCTEESDTLSGLTCERRDTLIHLNGAGSGTLIGVCNRAAAGGGLLRELQAFVRRLESQRPIIVRAAGYPQPASQTGQLLRDLRARGGLQVQVENSEWRAILAMRDFRNEHGGTRDFKAWLATDRPLTRLPGFRALFELDTREQPKPFMPAEPEKATGPAPPSSAGATTSPEARSTAAPPSAAAPGAPAPRQETTPAGSRAPTAAARPIHLGKTLSRLAEEVHIGPEDLKRHVAFLGGTGSGKTTLAMRLIEGLLFRGVPALLIDRKGDLCGYANPRVWHTHDSESARKLRGRIETALYTPGHPHGRPLRLRLLPRGMAKLTEFERGKVADLCAANLCGMMGYGSSASHKAQRALLKAALDEYGKVAEDDPPLDDVIAYIDERDPRLLEKVGNLKPRTFDDLIQNLEVLRIAKDNFFAGSGETLDCDRFFAPTAGMRTRLSIISTKFLGNQADAEFWVAQLLIELGRWINEKPSISMQGVVFCDEADLYLPAQRQPATKQPMEDLLRRARSAGIGMLLATQSPGDFDYKCRDNIRTWFLGKIKEDTALNKMKPMLQGFGGDMAGRLPSQETGQFLLANEQGVTPFAAERCLIPPEQLPEEEILAVAMQTRR